MGQSIERLAPQYGFDVVLCLRSRDNIHGGGISAETFNGVDVAIEFTNPAAASENLKLLAKLRIPTVTGTTGWLHSLPDVTRSVEEFDSGLVWSPNFSVGVAVFNKLAALAAELLRDDRDYGAWAWEIHHDTKKDAPSGTLLHVLDTMKRSGYQRHIDVSSSRAGRHPGTHEIGFDSEADTITLRHVARNREGFARGALRAAEWILNRRGVYTFEQMLFGVGQ